MRDDVKNWIVKAENDLKVAMHEIETKEPVTDAICFHAQQCVEKYLKAFLVYYNQSFRKTHNISEILVICIEKDPEFKNLQQINAHELTVYATELRYPEFFHIPSIEEAKEAIEIAKKVKEFVIKKLRIQQGEI